MTRSRKAQRAFGGTRGALAAVFALGCVQSPRQDPDQWLRAAAVEGPHKGAQSELLPIETDDAVWGDRAAPVTLMAFLDFQCSFCQAAHPTLRALMQKYGPRRMRFVFKHYPLPSHELGIRAAFFARAVQDVAGSGAFFVFEDNLYSEVGEGLPLSEARLTEHAVRVGVSREQLSHALASAATRDAVWRDVTFAERIGVQAVPAFLINGVPLQGALPREYFERVIDGELEAAAQARARGTPPGQIYDERVRANVQAAKDRRGP